MVMKMANDMVKMLKVLLMYYRLQVVDYFAQVWLQTLVVPILDVLLTSVDVDLVLISHHFCHFLLV